MDTKETLIHTLNWHAVISKCPIVGMTLLLIASSAFYACQSHDQTIWETLFDYHSKNLLKTEAPLYQDFYKKRLLIEGTGTESTLLILQDALLTHDNKILMQHILSDRSFRIFLEGNASVYFPPKEQARWLKHNKVINQYLAQLSHYHFAILPERFSSTPKAIQLISYIFVEQHFFNFLSNALLLLLLCIYIEPYIKRIYFIGFIAGFSLIYACTYSVIGHTASAPLLGLNALVYILSCLSISVCIQQQWRTRFKHLRLQLSLALILFSSKLALDIFYVSLSQEILYLLLFFSLLSLITAQPLYQLARDNTQNSLEPKQVITLPQDIRERYAEALKGVSRFNFNYARQQLRLLLDKAPHSPHILESSYHLEKLIPDNALFGTLVQARIERALLRQDLAAMQSIFQDIQRAVPKRSAAKAQIPPDYYLKMLVVFLTHHEFEKAEHAFMFLELAGHQHLVQEACKLLIEAFKNKKLVKKQTHYQALYQSYH